MSISGNLSSGYASAVYSEQGHAQYTERISGSPFIERIWRTQSERDDVCLAIADGRWDMMFFTHNGHTKVMVIGPQTTAISIPHIAGSDWLGIRFRLGVSMHKMTINKLIAGQ